MYYQRLELMRTLDEWLLGESRAIHHPRCGTSSQLDAVLHIEDECVLENSV